MPKTESTNVGQNRERIEYIECACRTPSHLLKVERWDTGEVVISTQLNHYQTLWQRIKAAVNFVLKRQSHEAEWDCTIIERDSDKARLISLLQPDKNHEQG